MTVYKDGEKFACRQCIQGHRVSTCHHEERPLIHVARKGRPVSQCIHCRGLRKSRQTHIKCDCSERRHSRTTSSESATLTGSDENSSCQCGHGKKCTCAPKKDYEQQAANVPSVRLDPFVDPLTGKPHIPNRRSESAIPRLRNHYQPALQRLNMVQPEFRFPAVQPSREAGLGRSFHAAQRSVDSLPLLNTATSPLSGACLPPAAFDNQRYLDPNKSYTMGSPLRNQHTQASFGDYSVSPLGQEVTQRTLSPHHPKRHSMNDFGNLLSQFSNESMGLPDFNFQPLTPQNHRPTEFPFPISPDQWVADEKFQQYASSQRPPLLPQDNTSLQDFTFPPQPGLSRSSSPAALSEACDSTYHRDNPPSYSGTQPIINIDTTWSMGPYDEKNNNYDYTPLSYTDTPSDFTFGGDATLPNYSFESAGASAGALDFSDQNDFVYTPVHSRHGSMAEYQYAQTLPDRSITHWANASEPVLNTAFKFPNNDPTFSEPFSENIDELDWQFGGSHNMLKIEPENS